MEKAGKPTEEIVVAHHKAISLAKRCNCPKKEIPALKNFAAFLKQIHRDEECGKYR
jgi:hypothetical protein